MINLTEQDKKYIDSNHSLCNTSRGTIDFLNIVERKFGEGKKEIIIKEMKELEFDISDLKESTAIPLRNFIAMLVVTKEALNLKDEDMYEIGREGGKISFLFKFASRLLVSIEAICENVNNAWHKYYREGDFQIIELDKERKRITAEIRDFKGHPLHCKYLEGFFSQMFFFITGKKTKCYEEECVFKGGNAHRYILEWE